MFFDLEYPWFNNKYSFNITCTNPLALKKVSIPNKYGGYDITFCLRARGAGYKITILPEIAKHIKMIKRGKEQQNEGVHNIEIWDSVKEEQRYNGPLTIT